MKLRQFLRYNYTSGLLLSIDAPEFLHVLSSSLYYTLARTILEGLLKYILAVLRKSRKNPSGRKMLYNLKMSVFPKIIFAIVALIAIIGLLSMPQKTVEVGGPLVTEKQQQATSDIAEKMVEENKKMTKSVIEVKDATAQPVAKQIEAETVALAIAPPPSLIPLEELNTKTRAALVNILCTTKWSGSFSPITGSGIIIDPKGVILTNAHVAQYYLLKDYLTKDF